MVISAELPHLQAWFAAYTSGFYTGRQEFDAALAMKVRHTQNVVLVISELAASLGLAGEDCALAEITALLHDIGRFPQYARYRTYADHDSENHAELGVAVIRENNLLIGLPAADRALVLTAVQHHNCAALPDLADNRAMFFLKLLRDADKVDVLQVVTDHYRGINTNAAIRIGLPDTPGVSPEVAADLIAGRLARIGMVKNRNDFKLLQVGFVFDLNFPRTYALFRERQYLDKLAAALPDTGPVRAALTAARQRLANPPAGQACPDKLTFPADSTIVG